MKTMEKIFTGMGEALWDMLPAGKQIGGAPANFAYHAGQLGFRGVAVSAVGRDALGDELREVFARKGLECLLEGVDYPTGTVQVTLDEAGVPNYQICEGVAWDNIPVTDELGPLAERTWVFCFGSLAQRNAVSREAIRRFLGRMPDCDGRLKVFDVNLRQHFYDKETIAASLEACNVLKLNDGEFEVLAPMFGLSAEPETGCRELLHRYGLRYVILTCGDKSSSVFSENDTSVIPTPRVKVADTVGAGDSFTAAFCAAVVAGKSLAEAHALAVEVSAFVCTQHGAMPEIPDALRQRLL